MAVIVRFEAGAGSVALWAVHTSSATEARALLRLKTNALPKLICPGVPGVSRDVSPAAPQICGNFQFQRLAQQLAKLLLVFGNADKGQMVERLGDGRADDRSVGSKEVEQTQR